MGGAVWSDATPGAVRSGVIPPPKTTPLHDPVRWTSWGMRGLREEADQEKEGKVVRKP